MATERVWTTELAAHVGEDVMLAGWLQRLRRLSQVAFLVLRDGQGTAQVVIEDETQLTQLAALPAESVLRVRGLVVAEAQAPGGVELHAASVELLSVAAPPPFELHRPTLKAQQIGFLAALADSGTTVIS